MARTGDVREQNAATTAYEFVLYDEDAQPRASFSYGSLEAARRGKELMDRALGAITGEAWPPRPNPALGTIPKSVKDTSGDGRVRREFG